MSHWFPTGPYETHCFVCSLSGLPCRPKARRKTNELWSMRKRRKTNIARRGCHTQTLAAKHPSPAPSDPQPLQNVLQRLQTVTRQKPHKPNSRPRIQTTTTTRAEGGGWKKDKQQTKNGMRIKPKQHTTIKPYKHIATSRRTHSKNLAGTLEQSCKHFVTTLPSPYYHFANKLHQNKNNLAKTVHSLANTLLRPCTKLVNNSAKSNRNLANISNTR